MTGPEHYRKGEKLLAESWDVLRPNDEGPCEADRMIAAANAHFLAAQITVQVALLADKYIGDGDHINAWRKATGQGICEFIPGMAAAAEGDTLGIEMNGIHTQLFRCEADGAHPLHLWRTGTEWFTCRGDSTNAKGGYVARFVRPVAAFMGCLRRALSPKEDRLRDDLQGLLHAAFDLRMVHEATTELPTTDDGDEK